MKLLIASFTLFFLILLNLSAQTTTETIFVKTKKQWEARFPKSNDTIEYLNCRRIETPAVIDSTLWHNYLQWNFIADTNITNHMPAGMYTLKLSFIINMFGRVVEAQCLSKTGYSLDSFVTNKLNTCPYTWSPATVNGRPVLSRQLIKLVFDINSGIVSIKKTEKMPKYSNLTDPPPDGLPD